MHLRINITVPLVQKIYLICSLLMFLIVNVDEAVGLHILVPHINGLIVYWHIILMVVVFMLMTVVKKGKWSIDFAGKLLLLKCVTDLISYILNINTVSEGFFGYYACSITAFFSYMVFIQEPCPVKDYYKYYLLFGVVLAIQTIQTFLQVEVDYFDIWYKTYVNIPYGATNIIASGIVPLIVLPFFMDMKKVERVAIAAFLIIGVVLTKSRGGVLLTFCAVAYAILFLNLFQKNKHIKRLLFLMIILIVLVLLFSNDMFDVFLSGYSGGNLNLNLLSTGRLKIFISDLRQFIEKPIFGHGLGLGGTNVSGSHNILIDLLYKCGIIGFAIYCMALFCIHKRKNNSFFAYFIFIMFINSLFEVCYFSYKCDTIFWCAAGLAMNHQTDLADGSVISAR